MKIVKNILRDHNWTIEKSDTNFIQASGNGFRKKTDLRSWSEFMTFEFTENEIKLNSICNPDGLIAQAFSFGKNRQNIRDFKELFYKNLTD